MTYEEFMALRTDQRDERLAEFLNTKDKDGSSPDVKWFYMRVTFRKIPAGNEYHAIAWMQHEGRTVATARKKEDTWHPSQTPLDTAREMYLDIQTSLATAEHAGNMARRLRNRLHNSVMPEVNFKPEVGDRVLIVAPDYFGLEGEVTFIYPPNGFRSDHIYDIRLDDGRKMATYFVMPPFSNSKETPRVG